MDIDLDKLRKRYIGKKRMLLEKRKKALGKFLTKISIEKEKPKPKKIPKRKIRGCYTKFQSGFLEE